jgi:SAM-dependent methyltransferase
LDAGLGTGRNIQFYPPEVQVVGIDISPAMLARAERKRLSLGADVELHQMDVTHLAFEDQSFDAAAATFLFCVLPDDLQVPALREIGRVVKSGGTIRLLEYVRRLSPGYVGSAKSLYPWSVRQPPIRPAPRGPRGMRYPYVDLRDFQLGAADGSARAHNGTIGERAGRGSMALNLLSGKPFIEWRSHRSESICSMPAVSCSAALRSTFSRA